MNMTVNAILAHDNKYGIGKDGVLPWPHSSADMKWFRECTNGHIVIMGRKTWESIGSKNLPKRMNIVVTRSEIIGSPKYTWFGDMKELIENLKMEYPNLKIWIIGGADIYRQTLHLCDNIFVTKIDGDYDCDAFVDMNMYLNGYDKTAVNKQDGLEFSIWSKN
jgi:dihydrofolate reductase